MSNEPAPVLLLHVSLHFHSKHQCGLFLKWFGTCRGDDDINDVAAMGGVNIVEETQRILGSTDFVGTQIRSCKDDIFLQASTLQHKIRNLGEFVSY